MMKVKITHTVRYEDIPGLVDENLNKCRSELRRCAELKFNILRLEETTKEIVEVQETLDLVSSQLEDCLNLAQGYVQVQQQMLEKELEEMDSTVNDVNSLDIPEETSEQDG